MKIKHSEVSQYPVLEEYRAHGKTFLIKRKLFTYDISDGIELSYWIYEKKRFLFWWYWSSLCQSCSMVSKDTIEIAKQFLENEYLVMSQVEYYSYDF